MTAWQTALNLTAPAGMDGVTADLATLASAADTTLSAAGNALDAAKVFLSGTAAPQAAAAEALQTEIQQLVDGVFGAGFYQLFAHPWVPGLGTGAGAFRSLSFPSLVRAIRDSFDDRGDTARPQFGAAGPCEMIVLVVGAPSPALFGPALDAFNALIGSKELRLAARRLAQAFDLESNRYTVALGSTPPDWHSVTLRETFPALADLEDGLKAALGMSAGYAKGGETAVQIASDLITAKQAQLATLQTRLANAAALFGQGLSDAGAYALHVTGAGGNPGLKSELDEATSAPGYELSFCAGVAWVGLDGTLGTAAEILGV